jgi:hypothetical protein
MKRKIILATVLSFVFGLSGVTFAYQQMSKIETTVACCCMENCCKGDYCPMEKKADATATTAASKKDCCCKGNSCPMKKNAGTAFSAAGKRDCCCPGSKSAAVKSAG